jgi:hypothetical protein
LGFTLAMALRGFAKVEQAAGIQQRIGVTLEAA